MKKKKKTSRVRRPIVKKPKARSRAKKKPQPRKVKRRVRSTTSNRKYKTQSGATLRFHEKQVRLTKRRVTKKSQKGRRSLEREYGDEFVKFYRKNRKKGVKFESHLRVVINVRGKRVKTRISLPRAILRSMRAAKFYTKDFSSHLSEILKKYLNRKDFKSISIDGLSMTVLGKTELKKKQSQKSKKKRGLPAKSNQKRRKKR